MKTNLKLFIAGLLLFGQAAIAQVNFTATLPSNQDIIPFGLVNGYTTVNIATDAEGNGYVLSSDLSDSSIWVTKYDVNGTQVYNVRVGYPGYETDYKYAARKIKIYGDRVYVMARARNVTWGFVQESVYIVNRNSGITSIRVGTFEPPPGFVSSELVDLVQNGNSVWLAGNISSGGGPGSAKIQVLLGDTDWTSNVYILGNDASTDYYLNTESGSSIMYEGSMYMTGYSAYAGTDTKILVGKLNHWGMWTEYKYNNPIYSAGAKGLSVAAEGGYVYASGSLRQKVTQPAKCTVMKLDTTLSSLAWISINKNATTPWFINLGSGNQVYTVNDYMKVIGFSKTDGNQLFSKNDFKNSVYTYGTSTALLSNNQLFIQGSASEMLKRTTTQNKVLVKYNSSGTKVYQQGETLTLPSPGNPDFAQSLGMAHASGANYTYEVFRKNNSSGQHIYVHGIAAPGALRESVTDASDEISLQVYPNPANDRFTLQCGQKIARWILYDTMLREVDAGTANDYTAEVNCSRLSKGLYFLKALTEDGSWLSNKITIAR
jgi:hypothetical protein